MDTITSEIPTVNEKKRPRENVNDTSISEKSKKKKFKKDLYKQPTPEEIKEINETKNLFFSNSFRSQIEATLQEVKLKEKYVKQFDKWFINLKKNIESIPETEEVDLSDKKSLKKLGITIPKIDAPVNEKGTYRFLKPSSISVIGAHSLGTTVSPNAIIDVMVQMPSKLFNKLDYQNYKYSRKRAIYLSYIASSLDSSIANKKTFIGDNWSPKLKLIPAGSLAKRVTIHLHLGAENGSFKLNRFSPGKNSIRPDWLFSTESSTADAVNLPPTPQYNSMILHDLTMAENNSTVSKIFKEYPNIRDGILLSKIWLYQRQSRNSSSAFNGHVLAMFVLYLFYERKIDARMSSYQIVRHLWNNLSLSDWSNNGISLARDEESKNRIVEYHKFYDCVFLDVTGHHNIAANLTVNNYEWIKSEAEFAVKCLNDANATSFHDLFLKHLPFYSTFDQFIRLHDTKVLDKIGAEKIAQDKKLDLGVNKRKGIIDMIIGVLKRGLGNRIFNIFVEPENIKEWDITKNPPAKTNSIFIGLQLNPDNCFSPIEKGPAANQPEAAEFREFWGNKSELRRFQDGNICEAVYWQKTETLAAKRIISKQIVQFVLKAQLDISKESYFYSGDEIDEFLQMKKTKITSFHYGTGEEATLNILGAFNELENQLTSLKDLPLSITGVQGSSPVFRYTDVFPPLATIYRADKVNTREGEGDIFLTINPTMKKPPQYAPAIDVIIQLSVSGKWPDELEAIRKTKAAFHLQIAECLRKQFHLKTKGFENHVIIYKSGFVFRIEIAQQKEIAYVKQQIDDNGVIKYRDNEESIELENKLYNLPKLSSVLHGLHSQQPSFGPTCCLVKRWLSAHLLDNFHIPDIVTELLVASMYLSPAPYRPAQNPQVGFLRFLEYFARERWSIDPVIINFNDEMTREEIVEIEKHFEMARESLPSLFISTPYDHLGSIWTKNSPSKVILRRVSALAKEVLRLVDTEFIGGMILNWKPMFKPITSEYNILIHLKDEFNPRRFQSFDLDDSVETKTWHPYRRHTLEKIPVVEFNPVESYLKELRVSIFKFRNIYLLFFFKLNFCYY